jgi:hypothetical protein
MTMNDPRVNPPRAPYQPVRNDNTGWIAAAVVAIVLLGGGFYWMNHRTNTASILPPSQTTGQNTNPTTPANPPAVMVSPAPAAGVPAPTPETTTGQQTNPSNPMAPTPAR